MKNRLKFYVLAVKCWLTGGHDWAYLIREEPPLKRCKACGGFEIMESLIDINIKHD